jgi:hypothetical protein
MLYGLSETRTVRSRNRADYSRLIRYIPFSSEVAIGGRAQGKETRYRMISVRAGSTVFEFPVASGSEPEFAAFRETIEPLLIQG